MQLVQNNITRVHICANWIGKSKVLANRATIRTLGVVHDAADAGASVALGVEPGDFLRFPEVMVHVDVVAKLVGQALRKVSQLVNQLRLELERLKIFRLRAIPEYLTLGPDSYRIVWKVGLSIFGPLKFFKLYLSLVYPTCSRALLSLTKSSRAFPIFEPG